MNPRAEHFLGTHFRDGHQPGGPLSGPGDPGRHRGGRRERLGAAGDEGPPARSRRRGGGARDGEPPRSTGAWQGMLSFSVSPLMLRRGARRRHRDPHRRHGELEGGAGQEPLRVHGGPRAEEPPVGHHQLHQRDPHRHVRRQPGEDPGDAGALQGARGGAPRPRARPAVHQQPGGGQGGALHRGPRPEERLASQLEFFKVQADKRRIVVSLDAPLDRLPGEGRPRGPGPDLHEPHLQRHQVQPREGEPHGAHRARRGRRGRSAVIGHRASG